MDSFCITIWPPIFQHVNKIHKLISQHFNCSNVSSFNIHSDDFLSFTQMLYQTDKRCHKPYLIEKVKYMKSNYDNKNDNKFNHYPISMIKYETKNPNYEDNISQEAVSIKEQLRNMFVNEVDNYIRDIIVHITDNNEDTLNAEKTYMKYNYRFLSKKLFDSLLSSNYSIMKIDERFPYYDDGDIDILTDNVSKVILHIKNYLNYIQDGTYLFNVSKSSEYDEYKNENNRIFIDVFSIKNKALLFRYDIHDLNYNNLNFIDSEYLIFRRKDFFKSILLNTQVENLNDINVKIPIKKYDLCIRFLEYLKYPSKKKHFIYIIKKVYDDYIKFDKNIFNDEFISKSIETNSFLKNQNEINDIPLIDIRTLFYYSFFDILNKFKLKKNIELKDMDCRVHDISKVNEFNEYLYKYIKKDQTFDNFIENNYDHFLVLDEIVKKIFVNKKIENSPLVEMLTINELNEIEIDEKKFYEYHDIDKNFILGSKKNKEYTIDRFKNLYEEVKVSTNNNYGIRFLHLKDNVSIYDGHHRCAILYKLFNKDCIISPKMFILNFEIDIGEYKNDKFLENITNNLSINKMNNSIIIPVFLLF